MADENVDTADATSPDGGDSAAPAAPATNQDSQDPKALDLPEIESPDGDGSAPMDPASAVDLLGDVDLDVKIELGRCRMQVGDVLRLQPGSVVELDKLAGDPVDVYVNERLVARGEVLVVNDNFCVRVNDVLAAEADNE